MTEIATIYIPPFACEVLCKLKENGYTAVLVGGCIRDSLMGKAPSDYDIATSASPNQIKASLQNYKTIDTGFLHGTVTVVRENETIEITSFRLDGEYSDHRRPDKVVLTDSLEEDLARRDFTVNAIAYNPELGLVDLFCGEEDIKNKIIRSVGPPEKRFIEDALRIMRALRFSATLGFYAEPDTDCAIHKYKPLLCHVSDERIFTELCSLLTGKNATDVLLSYSDVICTVIPEFLPCVGLDQKNPHHIYDVYTHSAKAVGACPADITVRLAAFFHDIAKPQKMTLDEDGIGHFRGHQKGSAEMAEKILQRFHCDRSTIQKVKKLILWHDIRPKAERISIRHYLSEVGREDVFPLLYLRRADLAAQSPFYHGQFKMLDETENLVCELIEKNECICIRDLKINGDDVIALGVKPGKACGCYLNYILDLVLDEKIENERFSLLQLLENLISQNIFP